MRGLIYILVCLLYLEAHTGLCDNSSRLANASRVDGIHCERVLCFRTQPSYQTTTNISFQINLRK